MKVGVLNSYTRATEDARNTNETEVFKALFSTVQHPLTFVEYRVADGDFPEPDACDAFLITGSPSSAYDSTPWIVRLRALIPTLFARGVPVIGVCFGHQVLAHALGGRVEPSAGGFALGREVLPVRKQPTWMVPARDALTLHYFHGDQVVALPPGAETLGGSERCPNGLFVIRRKVLGIQAHPEMVDGRIMIGVGELRATGDEGMKRVADEAERTLVPGIADGAVVAQWMVNFLKG